MPGGRAALPVGGGLVGVVVTVLILLLGGGGYSVDSPFEQFPAQPAAGGSTMDNAPDAESELVDFSSFVVGDLQKFWSADFQKAGRGFSPTQLVLFRQRTPTGCGEGSSATGPFYCPLDGKVYLDLGFFRELAAALPGARRLRAGVRDRARVRPPRADAHGHRRSRSTTPRRENADQRNALSVRTELQADCFAGVWAHSTFERGLLEQGDLEEGLTAAASVGDDRIQEQATGRISPETFTHGTAEQRTRWFRSGFDRGDATACDTFSGDI